MTNLPRLPYIYPHPYNMDWCWSFSKGQFFRWGTTQTRKQAILERWKARREFLSFNHAV